MGLLARYSQTRGMDHGAGAGEHGNPVRDPGVAGARTGRPHTWIMPTASSSRCRRETGSPCACLAMRATSGFESRTARTSHSRTFCVISRSMPLPMSTTRISGKDCRWPG